MLRILLDYLEKPSTRESGKKEKVRIVTKAYFINVRQCTFQGKSMHELCLEGFLQLCQTVFSRYSPNHIDRFLLFLQEHESAGGSDTAIPSDSTVQEIALNIIRRFQVRYMYM